MGVEQSIDGHATSLWYHHGLAFDHLREVEPACIAQRFPAIRSSTPLRGLSGTTVPAIEVLSVASLLDGLGDPKLVRLSGVDLPGAKQGRYVREV